MADVLVVDAAGAAQADRETIARGVPSRALMQRAGAAAAGEIARRYPEPLRRGATVYVGGGNNGGDGWVVARALRAAGVHVQVHEAAEAKADDAAFERALLLPMDAQWVPGASGVAIDALLGTGSSGAPRGGIAEAIARVNADRAGGSLVVALDVPSGVDATTGVASEPAVRADLTLTFGTLKRGLLVAREHAGEIAVLDIGLAPTDAERDAPRLVDAAFVAARVPRIAADAHKGVRRRLLIVGGGAGMVGAAVLAARAAHRSGIGLVRLCVAPENVPLVQQLVPEAIAAEWPLDDDEARDMIAWAHGVLIGPGLGRSPHTRALVERLLDAGADRVTIDADALNVFEGDTEALARRLAGRAALLTPHPAELARLAGITADEVVARRFDIGGELARTLGATVLLKGVPTVVHSAAAHATPLVSAAGTPALAVGGSGDLLAGVCATLLAQTGDALASGACGAWVHGRAAELASADRSLRGVTLDEVTACLGAAWPSDPGPSAYPVLATIPRVGTPRP